MSIPRISIVIPARNEEQYLPGCLDALQAALAGFSHEIIVVLNRCTDSTEQIARSRGCRIANEDGRNLARIRNAGARLAQGEILITVDADSRVSANMFAEIERALASGAVVGGGVLMLPERWSLGIVLTAFCLVPVVVWHGISGGLFFCTRSDFEAIGGFDERFVSVEDIDFARRLKAHGKRDGRRFVTLFRASIRTSCRKFDRLGDWYFLKRPGLFFRLLKGRDQAAADKLWYEFKR